MIASGQVVRALEEFMMSCIQRIAFVSVAICLSTPALATTVVNEGAFGFQGTWNVPNSGLVDIVNPLASPNQVNTSEWTISTSGGGATGTFATSNNSGEPWTKVFDHSASTTGPWGPNTSKVCCGGVPASVAMVSSTTSYALSGYELTLSNDSPNRDPKDFVFQGTVDGGANWNTIDTQTGQFNVDPGRNVTFLYQLGFTTIPYNGFRFNFSNSQDGSSFALAELEVFGTAVPEPASLVLFGLGMIGLLAAGRRCRGR